MKQLYALISLVLFSAPLLAATDPNVAAYSIPEDAVKSGPFASRDSESDTYSYYLAGSERKLENLIGNETYYKGVLINRELFQDGQKHGIQREWYRGGQLKTESPYNKGLMDGTFKHWNERGKLVGQYEMVKGKGVRWIYDSTGELIWEEHLLNNEKDGLVMELLKPELFRSIVWFEHDQYVGKGFSFYPDGSMRRINCFAAANPYSNSMLHGPSIEFALDGTVTRRKWYIKNAQVTEVGYAKAAVTDPTLPPYYSDVTRYKEFVTPNIKALVAKYSAAPRVKIPLEFDNKGEPVLAPPQPAMEPKKP